jgi:hypothetical protein
MDNLIFYDKEGNFLNFNWNNGLERYEGDILFHENSNDTFKTQALYTFEKVPSFEFEDFNSLFLRRFQLFNEFGFHFYNAPFLNQNITSIEPTNNRSDYFSKWIFGVAFHEKFPVGTLIRFNQTIFEFNDPNRLYTVVQSKRDAILIISVDDNAFFTFTYPFTTYNYTETISAVNAIGIYDYSFLLPPNINTSNLSTWNEQDFFNRIYQGRKFNIVNSFRNDNYRDSTNGIPKRYEDVQVVTVENENILDLEHIEFVSLTLVGSIDTISFLSTSSTLTDSVYTVIDTNGAEFEVTVLSGIVDSVIVTDSGSGYSVGQIITIDGFNIGGTTVIDDLTITVGTISTLLTGSNLSIRIKMLTDLPIIYTGIVDFYDTLIPLNIFSFQYPNVIQFVTVPDILKPGVEFNVQNTTNNTQNYTVANIPQFLGNANLITYNLGTQVIWNNKIYQCIQTHDWVLSGVDVDLTSTPPRTNATPDDNQFWSDSPTYVPVLPNPTSETISSTDVYLTSDEFEFIQGWTISSNITLASAVDKFREDLRSLNIDLSYVPVQPNGIIRADLIYPSLYADIQFFDITQSGTQSLITNQINTIERTIEISEEISSELNYDISQNFKYDIVFTDLDSFGIIITINGEVYDIPINFQFTLGQIDMDQTILFTLTDWFNKWNIILARLGILSSLQIINSLSINSIRLVTEYPNVPLNFEVQVGSTAEFFIQNKRVQFYEPSLENINGVTYSLGNYINIRVNDRNYGITHSDFISNNLITSDIQNTLERWIDEYSDILDDFGIFVESFPTYLEFNTKSQIQRCDIVVNVSSVLPGDLNFEIIDLIEGNLGTLITSNEIGLSGSSTDFSSAGFSTGMVTGANSTFYPLQNLQYNILFLNNDSINLSYEGPFWGAGTGTSGPIGSTGSPFNSLMFNNSFLTNIPGVTPSNLTFSSVSTSNLYGGLSPNYSDRNYLWLHSLDFIRRPRLNFSDDVPATLYWKWYSDNVPEFFLYDFSGDLLPTSGPLAYKGPKPLSLITSSSCDDVVSKVHLNRRANRDLNKVYDPEFQQTIFPIVYNQLSYIDDLDDISIVPEPIETYIGFNSQVEGPLRSILQIYVKEDIDFTINTKLDNTNVITFNTIVDPNTGERFGEISLDIMSNDNFWNDQNGVTRGLKVDQNLAIFIHDVSNSRSQYLSSNNGYLVKIKEVLFRKIKVEFFKDIDLFSFESTIINDYPKSGDITYLSVRFRVWDREIGRFNVYGQTEIEDIRYKIELNNVGKLISSDDVYIFKEYDIQEEGIDWIYLNSKRKEMLMMKSLIYPYIGSYKAIINAINYFGYNDLELYEYYRNVNIDSKNYLKLFKVEIPDIFSPYTNTWNESDFLKNTFPNPNFEETNLFNLTYRITDRQGNNLLTYTLREVQIKLQGLKYWLQKNIIPITHKIMDITGRADFQHSSSIKHIVRDVNIIKTHEDFTPVSFKLNELYLMPVNNGSTVYNCVLDFYFNTGNNQFYSGVSQSVPDYYTVDIRTYQIYREWYPFKNYEIGDRVYYFDKLYESVTDNNKTNNPRKYESVSSWEFGTIYSVGDVIEWRRDYYVYSGYGFTGSGLTGSAPTASVVSPILDSDFATASWLNITEWKEIDLKPIQRISEFRRTDNLYPFNFSIDSNIDPFLVIEVSSENGYGATYRDKKNYEIKGIFDVRELESFSNLTSKQYINAVIPIVNP